MVGKETVLVFEQLCHGCGGCAYFCPEKAIEEIDRPIGVLELSLIHISLLPRPPAREGRWGMIIAVASGKGGTGKTTVATNLALVLAGEMELKFLDCDVEEPNAHLFLKPEIRGSEPVSIPVPRVDLERCNYCGICGEVCAFNAIMVGKETVLVFEQLCHCLLYTSRCV